MSDITHRVLATIGDVLRRDPETVKPDASFIDDLGADELDALDILCTIEVEFGLDLADYDFSHFPTVGKLIAFVEARAP